MKQLLGILKKWVWEKLAALVGMMQQVCVCVCVCVCVEGISF
jgi:hypothetical protein